MGELYYRVGIRIYEDTNSRIYEARVEGDLVEEMRRLYLVKLPN